MEFAERLRACLKVEMLSGEIYYSLCNLFPEAKELFQQLAEEEERHADILTISIGFQEIGDLPEIIVPDSLLLIKKTQSIAETTKARIHEKDISLHTALLMALELEESFAESYFNEIMVTKTEYEVISYLQQFYKDETSHAQRIKDFMSNRGFHSSSKQ